ncbi:MAG: efflux RND transporter periplasmic adaptor subunit [Chitinophagales bacterium]|nr:efflux RND transporter periplasmic adaptor subunit [Chitinophagales bacterium]
MNTNPLTCHQVKQKPYAIFSLFLVITLFSLIISSCGGRQDWEQESGGQGSWDSSESSGDWGDSGDAGGWGAVTTYPVFEVSKKDYTGYNSYPANIEGIQDIEIRAKIGGYIQDIYVDEGQFVKKGQPLFKLEANAIAQNTKASGAAIKAEEAAISTALARVSTFEIEVNRLQPLVDKNIVSDIQLQTAQANLQSAKAQVESAKARLNQAQSTHQGNRANENYTKIVSPVSGYVGKLNFRLGSLVGPSDVLALTTVSNTKEVYAYFSISEREFSTLTKHKQGKSLAEKLKTFPTLKLQLADGSDYPLEGKMDASTGKVSSQTGAIQLRASFDNPNLVLLSGSNGVIKIPTFYKNQIAIPATASFETQGQTMVYKLIPGDTLVGNPIHITDKIDRYFIVESGLNVGDKVLAQGVSKVYPYTAIKPEMVEMENIANGFEATFK